MDQKVERLFQEKNLIFIATINLDGSPQLTLFGAITRMVAY